MAKLPSGWLFIPRVINKGTAIEVEQKELVTCKNCKHFELDKPYEVDGWPIPILGHEVCNAWGDGCKTDPDGWCFMGELRGDSDD